MYFSKQATQPQGKCGDGICGPVEKKNNVCPQDCKISQNKKTGDATASKKKEPLTQSVWSSDTRLTNEKAISSLSFNNAHPFVFSNGKLYLAWTDARDGNAEIYFKSSSDYGSSWSSDLRLTNKSGISWYDWRGGNPEIYYSKSSDGGQNWGEQKRITDTSSQTGLPAMAFDDKNQINIVYLDGEKSGSMHMYYAHSSDNGGNWTTSSVKMNSYSNSWFPTIASDGKSGLFAVWQDTVNNDKEIFYAYSSDRGIVWNKAERLTQNSGDSTNPFIATDDKGDIHIVWEDGRDGNREIYYKNKKATSKSTSSSAVIKSTVSDINTQQSTDSCKWFQAENLGPSVNTSNTEKAPAISPDGKELYFFREASGGKFDIYLSEWNGSTWSSPANSGKTAKINSSTANDIGPFVSRDGLRLYFSSNRSGTNNYDIYYSSRSSTSESWGTPENLGNIVNLTNESELGPTLNQDETIMFFARGWPQGAKETSENLFYSEKKNGAWTTPVSWEHNTLAIEDNPELSGDGKTLYFSIRDDYNGKYYPDSHDFDVYVSKYENGKWQSPASIGSAINTKYHDANFAISADGKTIYFSSKDRSGGYGNFDIYVSKCE